MSRLPKTIELDRLGIERLKVPEDEKAWLRQLVDTLEEKYKLVRDFAEAGGMGAANWVIREAKAADVTAGNANTVGDLMVKHKTTGTEWLFESTA